MPCWDEVGSRFISDTASSRDTAVDGDPRRCCVGAQGRGTNGGYVGLAFPALFSTARAYMVPARLSIWIACLTYPPLVSEYCPVSHDNDVTRRLQMEGPCEGFAGLPGPGRTNKVAREESSGSSPGKSSGVSRPPVA